MSQVTAIDYFFQNEGKLIPEELPENFHISPIQDEILSCIYRNDANLLEEIMKDKAQFSLNFHVSTQGLSPILLIAAKGSNELLATLMRSGQLDVNFSDMLGANAFWYAALYGRIQTMKLLAERGVDIYKSTVSGTNALHVAAKKDHHLVLKTLLKELEYKPDSRTKKGFTALHLAAAEGNVNSVTHLLDFGADVKILTQQGYSALYLALYNKYFYEPDQSLFQNTEDLKIQKRVKKDEFLAVIELLVKFQARIYFKTMSLRDKSPLFLAIDNDDREILEIFNFKGFDFHANNAEEQTPLLYACRVNAASCA